MYIGTVGVIPELLVLQENRTKSQEFMDGLKQLIAMFVGIGLMTYKAGPFRANQQCYFLGIEERDCESKYLIEEQYLIA